MNSPDRDQPSSPIEDLLRRCEHTALTAEAHAVMHGRRHLTIEHGYPETTEDAALVTQLSDAAWRGIDGARAHSVGGGGDYTTITIYGPKADTFIDELAALATDLNPGWWRMRCSAR